MLYYLEQDNYRCHCGRGIYLGYKFYPQPFFLLQVANLLRSQNHEVALFDHFRHPKIYIDYANGSKRIVNIGEYAADAQYPQTYPGKIFANQNGIIYTGSYIWLYRPIPNNQIMEPEVVFNYIPAWDLIDFTEYPRPEGRLRAVLRLSLGCPNKCIFCPVPILYKGKYHSFDLEWAQDQLLYLYLYREIREFSFIDDNLFANIQLGKELIDWLIRLLPQAKFFLQEGLEVNQALDQELCSLLYRAHFYDIRIGVETLNPEVLVNIRKPYIPGTALEAVSNLQNVGFGRPRVFLIENLPGNNRDNELEDIKILKDMGCNIRSQPLKLYPHTPLWKQIKVNNE